MEGSTYRCFREAPGLTIGKLYKEFFLNPNVFNAAVTKDDGEVAHYPRKQHFTVVERIYTTFDTIYETWNVVLNGKCLFRVYRFRLIVPNLIRTLVLI